MNHGLASIVCAFHLFILVSLMREFQNRYTNTK